MCMRVVDREITYLPDRTKQRISTYAGPQSGLRRGKVHRLHLHQVVIGTSAAYESGA